MYALGKDRFQDKCSSYLGFFLSFFSLVVVQFWGQTFIKCCESEAYTDYNCFTHAEI